MSSKRKERGENTVRCIEEAARLLNMSIGQFFAYAMNKENEKRSQNDESMRDLLCTGNPTEIDKQAKHDALRFGFLKDGNLDSSFVISGYYIRCATGVVKSRKLKGSYSHRRECSVRANFARS